MADAGEGPINGGLASSAYGSLAPSNVEESRKEVTDNPVYWESRKSNGGAKGFLGVLKLTPAKGKERPSTGAGGIA